MYFHPLENGQSGEIGRSAEVREVRKRFKAILVANLGYGKLCHDKVVMNVLAFAFQHPLISGLSKRIPKIRRKVGTALPNWAKFHASGSGTIQL